MNISAQRLRIRGGFPLLKRRGSQTRSFSFAAARYDKNSIPRKGDLERNRDGTSDRDGTSRICRRYKNEAIEKRKEQASQLARDIEDADIIEIFQKGHWTKVNALYENWKETCKKKLEASKLESATSSTQSATSSTQSVSTILMFNAALKALMKPEVPAEFSYKRDWLTELKSCFGLSPTSGTYALLIGGQSDHKNALQIFHSIGDPSLKTEPVFNALLKTVGRSNVATREEGGLYKHDTLMVEIFESAVRNKVATIRTHNVMLTGLSRTRAFDLFKKMRLAATAEDSPSASASESSATELEEMPDFSSSGGDYATPPATEFSYNIMMKRCIPKSSQEADLVAHAIKLFDLCPKPDIYSYGMIFDICAKYGDVIRSLNNNSDPNNTLPLAERVFLSEKFIQHPKETSMALSKSDTIAKETKPGELHLLNERAVINSFIHALGEDWQRALLIYQEMLDHAGAKIKEKARAIQVQEGEVHLQSTRDAKELKSEFLDKTYHDAKRHCFFVRKANAGAQDITDNSLVTDSSLFFNDFLTYTAEDNSRTVKKELSFYDILSEETQGAKHGTFNLENVIIDQETEQSPGGADSTSSNAADDEAIELSARNRNFFRRMFASQSRAPFPDGISHINILSALAKAKRHREALVVFESMSSRFVDPKITASVLNAFPAEDVVAFLKSKLETEGDVELTVSIKEFSRVLQKQLRTIERNMRNHSKGKKISASELEKRYMQHMLQVGLTACNEMEDIESCLAFLDAIDLGHHIEKGARTTKESTPASPAASRAKKLFVSRLLDTPLRLLVKQGKLDQVVELYGKYKEHIGVPPGACTFEKVFPKNQEVKLHIRGNIASQYGLSDEGGSDDLSEFDWSSILDFLVQKSDGGSEEQTLRGGFFGSESPPSLNAHCRTCSQVIAAVATQLEHQRYCLLTTGAGLHSRSETKMNAVFGLENEDVLELKAAKGITESSTSSAKKVPGKTQNIHPLNNTLIRDAIEDVCVKQGWLAGYFKHLPQVMFIRK